MTLCVPEAWRRGIRWFIVVFCVVACWLPVLGIVLMQSGEGREIMRKCAASSSLCAYFIAAYLLLLAHLWTSSAGLQFKINWTLLLVTLNMIVLPIYWLRCLVLGKVDEEGLVA